MNLINIGCLRATYLMMLLSSAAPVFHFFLGPYIGAMTAIVFIMNLKHFLDVGLMEASAIGFRDRLVLTNREFGISRLFRNSLVRSATATTFSCGPLTISRLINTLYTLAHRIRVLLHLPLNRIILILIRQRQLHDHRRILHGATVIFNFAVELGVSGAAAGVLQFARLLLDSTVYGL